MKFSLLILTVLPSVLLAAGVSKVETHERVGGLVAQPDSSRGFVAVVNRQQKVPAGEFAAVIAALDRQIRYDFRIVDDETAALGATLTIRLLDDPSKEPFLAAPDSCWADVNVARLTDDLKSDNARARFLVPRARKMFLRAYAYAAGSGGSGFPGNIFDISSIRDLDYCKEFLPMDVIDSIQRHLKKRGMVVQNIDTYENACAEGWAPAPTNDVQKAIWEKVHAPPKNPIKIEFDPKKGR